MRRHISNKKAGAVLIASGVVAATLVSAAAATTHAASGGKESFLISYGPHESEVVVAHGAFTGGGKVDGRDAFDTLNLGGGSLRIYHPDSKSKFHQHLNPTTCFASITITGSYTLGHGTGKYAGYSGHGMYTVTSNAIAKRTKSGACNEQADPTVEAAFIRASGPLSK